MTPHLSRRRLIGTGAGAAALAAVTGLAPAAGTASATGATIGSAKAASARAAPTPTPTVSAVTAASARRVAPFPVGYSTGSSILWASAADANQTLDGIVNGGGTHVRIPLMWYFAQPTATTYNWAPFDSLVSAAELRGLTILGILGSTPGWAASGGGTSPMTRPSSAALYASFAQAAATRYKGRIAAYEIWNEPNSSEYFSPKPDPAFYAALVKAAYPAIRKVDPAAVVVAAAVGPAPNTSTTMTAFDFVAGMYANGAKGYFDALSFHPYEYSQDFATNAVWDNGPIRQMMAMHAQMVVQGDSAKKIWVTEYGAPTSGPSAITPAAQAALLTASISAWAEVSFAGPFFVYTFRDGTAAEDSFGVVGNTFTPKPSYTAVKRLQAAGVPARDEAKAFASHPDSTLGAALSPIFALTNGYSQDFDRGTRSLTNNGWFTSPPAVAVIARHFRVVPSNAFTAGRQDFDSPGGCAIFFSAATGAHAVVGAILAGYTSALGLPTTDEYASDTSGSRAVDFVHGRIVWSPTTGTKVTLS